MSGDALRPLEFWGSSLNDLREFPDAVRQDAGYQLHLVQQGKEPDDWKPMKTIGSGVREIRVRDATGAFRIIYVVKFGDAVIVLHCFEKRGRKTGGPDVELAKKRYTEVAREYGK